MGLVRYAPHDRPGVSGPFPLRELLFIGNVIYTNIGIANNVPFAAAMALVPIVVMGLYLSGARALGAFEAL